MAVNKCLKYLLFFFNLLFWISGCIILGVSIYLKVNKDNNSISSEPLPGVDLLIAVGVIIMLLGFLGCCGAIKENRCMLLLFFISLLLIFVLLVAAGILGAVGESKVKEWIEERMNKYLPLSNQPETVKEDLYKLQAELKCCGLLKGPADWTKIPESCKCPSATSGTTPDPDCDSGGLYKTTCTDRLIELAEKSMGIVLGIAFAIAILLIFGMVIAMILYCQIGKKDTASTA
ncbi:tetraspanin-8-like [Eucyclogobius newberryi]|uniref:tetraspanin-8-like n=1 Tax=Eucyclogobius newberryi TaxID=166745 RepID=UPI003B596A3D